MKKLLIFVCVPLLASCKGGNHQVVELKNLSSTTIYFLISGNRTPNNNEIGRLRPITSNPMTDVKVKYEDKEQERTIKHNLYRNRIERDNREILLSSESAEIFADAITIQNIIDDRYNGQLHVFVITETDLLENSHQEIIDKKLCKHFKILTGGDITTDPVLLEYF